MKVCPHCGAENVEGSSFCSLCLARFETAGKAATAAVPPSPVAPDAPVYATQAATMPDASGYVTPGDYRALAQEIYQEGAYPPGRDSAFDQAARERPGSISAVPLPARMARKSVADIVLMVLLYSFLSYLLLFAVNLVGAMILVGAAFGGSEAGWSVGVGILYALDALALILSGYWISAKAMEAGRGWLYGLACVATVVFFWGPAIALFFMLFITGRLFTPVFDLVGLMVSIFLYLPLGALGGWIAEKRYMG